MFNDPALDTLVERAARGNLGLQEAVLRIVEARVQVHGAAARFAERARNGQLSAGAARLEKPSGINGVYDKVNQLGAPDSAVNAVAPGAGATLQNGANGVLNQLTSPVNLWQAGFDGSWEVDLLGRVRRSVEADDARSAATEESRNDALLSLEAEIAQTYVQLRGAQQMKNITTSLVDQQREIVTLTQSQAKVGMASEMDVKSASAQLAQTQTQMPLFEQQVGRP